LIGAFIGFQLGSAYGLFVGLLGAFGGAWLARRIQTGLFNKRHAIPPAEAAAIQATFFDCSFAVMGHVAKADGQVDAREIALAEALMRQMQLDADRRRAAIARFSAGKEPDFDLDGALEQVRAASTRQPNLLIAFLEIQLQAALADGDIDPTEERVLLTIAERFGIPEFLYRRLETLVRQGRDRTSTGGAGTSGETPQQALEAAYDVLGVNPTDGRETVKGAWRRLMSEHHPDKLVSQGLPPEMMDIANERAQTIQKAWERIREARGWR
jgi:DnaJ like chaperone protein